jgi:hypothetical protein
MVSSSQNEACIERYFLSRPKYCFRVINVNNVNPAGEKFCFIKRIISNQSS